MAVLSNRNPTLLDLAKVTAPDGSISQIVEILNETNEVLMDMSWKEGNLPTGHRTTMRAGIPDPTWRRLYEGVQPTKSQNVQVTDNTGMLEAYAEVDKALADLNNNTAAFRLTEDRPHIEGISQTLAQTIFYGNESTLPASFTGLAPRFNDKSAENGDNIIDAGGDDASNASVWLVVWGDSTCHGIVPKGSQAGIQFTDKGQVTIEDVDGNGGRMEAYRSHYRLDAGMSVPDWRYVVRVANIKRAALTKDRTGAVDLPDLLFQAMDRVPNLSAGRSAFYMDRTVRNFLRRQLSNATSGSTLEVENVGGVMVYSFQGVPIRRVDKLAVNEALVT